jgi:hypothetical protein
MHRILASLLSSALKIKKLGVLGALAVNPQWRSPNGGRP